VAAGDASVASPSTSASTLIGHAPGGVLGAPSLSTAASGSQHGSQRVRSGSGSGRRGGGGGGGRGASAASGTPSRSGSSRAWAFETASSVRGAVAQAVDELQGALQAQHAADRLQIFGVLGQGGFGTVYQGAMRAGMPTRVCVCWGIKADP
jgi:hypothetical protein